MITLSKSEFIKKYTEAAKKAYEFRKIIDSSCSNPEDIDLIFYVKSGVDVKEFEICTFMMPMGHQYEVSDYIPLTYMKIPTDNYDDDGTYSLKCAEEQWNHLEWDLTEEYMAANYCILQED